MNEQDPQLNEFNQNPKSIWIIISSVIITALIVSGGVYAWQTWQKLKSTEQFLQQRNEELPKEQAQKNIEAENGNLQTEDKNANWKTYRNNKYGFEFKYPQDAKVTFNTYRQAVPEPEAYRIVAELPKNKINMPPWHEIIIFDIKPTNTTRDDLYADYLSIFGHRQTVAKFSIGTGEGVLLYEYSAVTRSTNESCAAVAKIIYNGYEFDVPDELVIQHDPEILTKRCVEINTAGDSDEYNKILSTFRFL